MASVQTRFGSAGAYYAAHSIPKGLSRYEPTPQEGRILALLGKGTREQVERAFKTWNSTARNMLSDETGLKLSVGPARRVIQVKVQDGLPDAFAALLADYKAPVIWLVMLRKALLDATVKGLDEFVEHYNDMMAFLDASRVDISSRDVANVRDVLLAIVRKADDLDLLRRLRSIDHDVLGAYFLNRTEIHLYWMVIGIVARLLDLPVAGLALVVLVHELAHGYTHVGLDIDQHSWDTGTFARAEMSIAEGLAQYYTEAVCRRLSYRVPEALRSFQVLSRMQPAAYNCHSSWFEPDEPGSEVVRFAMLEARKKNVTQYSAFLEKLGRAAENLRVPVQKRLFQPTGNL